MNWRDRAEELKQQLSWTELYKRIKLEYPNENLKDEKIRSALRYRQKKKGGGGLKPIVSTGISIHDSVKDLLKTTRTLDSLADSTGQTTRIIKAVIEDIKDTGIQITEDKGTYLICRDIVPQDNVIDEDWDGEKIIRFGLMGDPQFNSKYCQITHLHNFYDILADEGITKVYNTGDIDEGEEMRTGHKYECYTQGAEDHIDEIVKNYPKRKGMVTEFITGNHDHSFIKRAGLDIGKSIASKREDLKYLGMNSAIINLTPNCKLELRHPIDGTAYAISYKTQKMIEAMHGGDKPNILAIGHYHKAEYIFYRNIHAYQTGCFQGQTDWMRGKQIQAMVGGWIVEVRVRDDGEIARCTGTFIPYYKSIKDDYKNWR